MSKYIGTVRFLIAELKYNKRGIVKNVYTDQRNFLSLQNAQADQFKVYCSLIKAEVEQSLPCRPHFSPRSKKIDKLAEAKKVLESLLCHCTVQKLLCDQCAVNLLEDMKVVLILRRFGTPI